MVVIVILGILASLTLFALAGARNSARERKTQATIATLNELLMERYESYKYRRVPIDTAGLDPKAAAIARLDALRELMMIEMPERWGEVTSPPVSLLPTRTGLSESYFRRWAQMNNANAANPTKQYQGAECLYMIITMGTGEGEALSLFGDSEIGDVDHDGAPEFLDAWGHPISFLRWPAGFVSELQSVMIDSSGNAVGDPDKDHDPFDPMRIDPTAYRLVPLIYSSGPDGAPDIVTDNDKGTFTYLDTSSGRINPYLEIKLSDGTTQHIGQQADTGAPPNGILEYTDNIHNHLIGAK